MTKRVRNTALLALFLAAVGIAWTTFSDRAAPRPDDAKTMAAGTAPAAIQDADPDGTRVRRIDPKRRAELLAALATARSAREARKVDGTLHAPGGSAPGGSAPEGSVPGGSAVGGDDPEAARRAELRGEVMGVVLTEAEPLIRECHEATAAKHPERHIRASFTITGEPDVGGLVEAVDIAPAEPAAEQPSDPDFVECVRETLFSLEFTPPPEGARDIVTLTYQLRPPAKE